MVHQSSYSSTQDGLFSSLFGMNLEIYIFSKIPYTIININEAFIAIGWWTNINITSNYQKLSIQIQYNFTSIIAGAKILFYPEKVFIFGPIWVPDRSGSTAGIKIENYCLQFPVFCDYSSQIYPIIHLLRKASSKQPMEGFKPVPIHQYIF